MTKIYALECSVCEKHLCWVDAAELEENFYCDDCVDLGSKPQATAQC